MKINNLTVIVADDDEDDKGLLREALQENGIAADNVILVSDGEELITILPQYATKSCIILLDLNMPRMDGRKALEQIKTNNALKHIPVIIFTTSNAKADIIITYKLGGNTFFTKPFNYRELVKLVGTIKAYWFEKATVV